MFFARGRFKCPRISSPLWREAGPRSPETMDMFPESTSAATSCPHGRPPRLGVAQDDRPAPNGRAAGGGPRQGAAPEKPGHGAASLGKIPHLGMRDRRRDEHRIRSWPPKRTARTGMVSRLSARSRKTGIFTSRWREFSSISDAKPPNARAAGSRWGRARPSTSSLVSASQGHGRKDKALKRTLILWLPMPPGQSRLVIRSGCRFGHSSASQPPGDTPPIHVFPMSSAWRTSSSPRA